MYQQIKSRWRKKRVIIRLLISISIVLFLFSEILAKKILSLAEAQSAVINNSNEIKALESEVKAAKALIIQAGLRPNPELEVGMENGAGTDGISVNKIEVGVSQTIELGHKKEARIDVAEKNVKLKELDINQIKRELETETIRRFIPIAGLKNKLYLIDDMIKIVKNIHNIIKKRVEYGAAMEIDLLGTEIELENLAIEREAIERKLKNAKKNLTALMGENPIAFEDISTKLTENYTLLKFSELEKKLQDHNEIIINKMEQEVASAELQEIKANAITDLTIGIGYERNQEEEANAALIGVSIDLPIFNKNQGEIAQKKESILSMQHMSKNTSLQLKREILEQYNSFQNIEKQISAINERTLPRAEEMYKKVRELYEKSAVQIFDVIDTQIKLVETKMSIIELKTELAEIAADIYEITGYLNPIIEN